MKFKRQIAPQVIKHKPSKLIKFSVVIIGLLLIAQVLVSNKLANAGEHLSATESEISQLRETNIQLKSQVASASAMLTLKQRAQSSGFTENASPIFFSPDFPVALERNP